MSEWKELKIDDLPADILTGDYEFEFEVEEEMWIKSQNSIIEILTELKSGSIEYRYRKPEPKAPTHEEIMTKWWLMGDLWIKVISYSLDRETCYCLVEAKGYVWGASDCFTGRQSADIPPEEV